MYEITCIQKIKEVKQSALTLVSLFMSFITSVEACIPLDILTMLAWDSICIITEFICALLAYNLLTALWEPTISFANILQTSLSPFLAASFNEFFTWVIQYFHGALWLVLLTKKHVKDLMAWEKLFLGRWTTGFAHITDDPSLISVLIWFPLTCNFGLKIRP